MEEELGRKRRGAVVGEEWAWAADASIAHAKPPLGGPNGVFVKKPGDTYFRAGRHYHRPGKLNGCVRDGNRCFLSGMVARRSSQRGKALRTRLVWFDAARAAANLRLVDLRFKIGGIQSPKILNQ